MKQLFNIQCKAFTLAEVLITLLIIGVIAAIVVPNLINDSKEAEYKAGAKKAFAEISNIVKQIKLDKGTLSGYIGNGNSFKPDFINYFSVSKDCGIKECVPQSYTSNIYTSLTGDAADTQQFGGEGQFITTDGMFINIQNSEVAGNGLIIIVDVNGYLKGPNVYGQDTFAFQVVNDVLVPVGAPYTRYSTSCDRLSPSAQQGLACAIYMLQDKDY